MSNPLDFTDLYIELGGFDLTSRSYTPQHFECLHKISLACLEQLRTHPVIDLVDVGMIAFVIFLVWSYSPDT